MKQGVPKKHSPLGVNFRGKRKKQTKLNALKIFL